MVSAKLDLMLRVIRDLPKIDDAYRSFCRRAISLGVGAEVLSVESAQRIFVSIEDPFRLVADIRLQDSRQSATRATALKNILTDLA